MKANEFDQKIDDGEDIIEHLDLTKANLSRSTQTTVSVDLPVWIVESIEKPTVWA